MRRVDIFYLIKEKERNVPTVRDKERGKGVLGQLTLIGNRQRRRMAHDQY